MSTTTTTTTTTTTRDRGDCYGPIEWAQSVQFSSDEMSGLNASLGVVGLGLGVQYRIHIRRTAAPVSVLGRRGTLQRAGLTTS